jgi:hypothetical protein
MMANDGEELSGAQGRTAPIKKNQSLTSEWDSKFFQEFLRLFADGVPPEPHCQFSDQRGYVGQCNVLRNCTAALLPESTLSFKAAIASLRSAEGVLHARLPFELLPQAVRGLRKVYRATQTGRKAARLQER